MKSPWKKRYLIHLSNIFYFKYDNIESKDSKASVTKYHSYKKREIRENSDSLTNVNPDSLSLESVIFEDIDCISLHLSIFSIVLRYIDTVIEDVN